MTRERSTTLDNLDSLRFGALCCVRVTRVRPRMIAVIGDGVAKNAGRLLRARRSIPMSYFSNGQVYKVCGDLVRDSRGLGNYVQETT
jgi:hypothetical protein